MKFTTACASILAAAATTSLVAATPVALEERVVVAPRLTYPHAGTVWNAGEVHNVTW